MTLEMLFEAIKIMRAALEKEITALEETERIQLREGSTDYMLGRTTGKLYVLAMVDKMFGDLWITGPWEDA
jgi:hypothetical protein